MPGKSSKSKALRAGITGGAGGNAGPPGAVDAVNRALAELTRAVKPIGDAELRHAVGPVFDALSPRQRDDLRVKLLAVRSALSFSRFAKGRALAIRSANIHETVQHVVGRQFCTSTLRGWLRVYRHGGARALLDTRGRPRGHMGLDPMCLVTFARARKGGLSVREAHRRARQLAEQRQLSWPRSDRTVAAILAEGVATIDWPKPPPSPDPNSHLVKDLSAN